MNPVYYQFPEALYPPIDSEYIERVNIGYNEMYNSSVVIAGLARNLGNHLSYTTARIEYLCGLFNESYIVLYTNDNNDDTDYYLKRWGDRVSWNSRADVEIISENLNKEFHGSVTTLERYKDMAYYRNKYLERVKNIEADYLIVLDTDVVGGYSYDGIANSFSWFDELKAHCIGSNSVIYKDKVRLHYDTLAFRRLNQPRCRTHSQQENNLLCYNRAERPIMVDSCFGGLAIYKLPTIKEFNLSYQEYDCDHVTLHNSMTENRLLVYMNPSMISLYSPSIYNGINK